MNNDVMSVSAYYPKKSTGKLYIGHNDAVEQALCFGWIDSIIKTLDEEHSIQRFSPRKPTFHRLH